MQKSLHIDLSDYFEAISIGDTNTAAPTLLMKDATLTHWRKDCNTIIEQEFNGKYGYLYSYEINTVEEIQIPVHVAKNDLHVLYLMEGSTPLSVYTSTGSRLCTIMPKRARYLYLPSGSYKIGLPVGYALLFGFYFDGSIFRKGSERPFRFLHNVITDYNKKSLEPSYSIDFHVGAETTGHIQFLCSQLRDADFNNESFVFNELSRLVILSRQKVFTEYERTSNPELLIQLCRQRIEQGIALSGNMTKIKTIAIELRVNSAYLNRLHKKYYQENISDYRNHLLVAHIKHLLSSPYSLLEVSIQARFHGPSEMTRFFKKHTGMTPHQYRLSLS